MNSDQYAELNKQNKKESLVAIWMTTKMFIYLFIYYLGYTLRLRTFSILYVSSIKSQSSHIHVMPFISSRLAAK